MNTQDSDSMNMIFQAKRLGQLQKPTLEVQKDHIVYLSKNGDLDSSPSSTKTCQTMASREIKGAFD